MTSMFLVEGLKYQSEWNIYRIWRTIFLIQEHNNVLEKSLVHSVSLSIQYYTEVNVRIILIISFEIFLLTSIRNTFKAARS